MFEQTFLPALQVRAGPVAIDPLDARQAVIGDLGQEANNDFSTPITTLSASWAACRGGAFTTICERPSTRSAAARSARSTPASRRWSAISYSRPSSAIQ